MNKRIYILFIAISVLIGLFFFTLVTHDSKNGKDTTNEKSNHNIEHKYSKKQIDMAKKRSDTEVAVDDKIQSYIIDTKAPKDQKAYDEALKMRDKNDRKGLKRDVKDILNQNREIKDLSTDTSYTNNKEMSGSYSYTLIYKKDGKTQSESKDGDYTLATNDDGYFYIKTFN